MYACMWARVYVWVCVRTRMCLFGGAEKLPWPVCIVLGCKIVESEFKLQSHYYVHFRANTFVKGMNPLFLEEVWIIPQLFYGGFGIK